MIEALLKYNNLVDSVRGYLNNSNSINSISITDRNSKKQIEKKTRKKFNDSISGFQEKVSKYAIGGLVIQWFFIIIRSYYSNSQVLHLWFGTYSSFQILLSIGVVVLTLSIFLIFNNVNITNKIHVICIAQILTVVLISSQIEGNYILPIYMLGSFAAISLFRDMKALLVSYFVLIVVFVVKIKWGFGGLGIITYAFDWIALFIGSTLGLLFLSYSIRESNIRLYQLSIKEVYTNYQVRMIREKKSDLEEQNETLEAAITLFRKSQEELQFINERLTRRTVELRKKNLEMEKSENRIKRNVKALMRADKYKNEFLANMSHEFKTPLNSILILSQLLRKNSMKRLSKEDIEFATRIEKSGENLLKLIEDVLMLAKLDAGKIKVKKDEILIEELLNVLRKEHITDFEKAGMKLIIECNESRGKHFVSDEAKVTQIINCLLSNARKFSEPGGDVILNIEVYNTNILEGIHNVVHRSNSDRVVISIQDFGIGISRKHLDQIFNQFEQLDGSSKRKYGGVGLGLAICKNMSIALGGEIIVKSELGKGSLFSLVLPIS
ncbi:MAG: hypothetical protein HRT72_09895 [Flavobacteriales bacterium]|nr:hypothetical protein [Flavobacteriales bacterium]